MNTMIKIKSSSNGLRIIMDEECSVEDLETALRQKLIDGRKFFGNAKMALSFEGKELTEEEQDRFCDIITECTDINIICLVDLSKAADSFQHCIRIVAEEYKQNDVCLIRNSVINQDFIDSEKDIIVLGDVHPGCTIISKKSIFIFGGLYGEAYAGGKSSEDSKQMILAMEMAPEELRIGPLCYQPAKKPRWGIKPKLLPQIAYASNDKINIEPYTKELLKRITE
ncbi:MAG: septum site-determining protein MinC [Lachnospiraceae bacterium]|nr:septum site-determining protein MinC [Lachnospiraceae bacterium]